MTRPRAPRAAAERLLELADADEQLSDIAGCRLGPQLGRGGMGAVFLLEPPDDGPPIALKVMLPDFEVDDLAARTFLREVDNTRAVHHPNVVEFRGGGVADGTLFLLLEYCSGGSVDRRMTERGGVLDPAEAVAIVRGALEGLQHAHTDRGLVHRDVKPQNILLAGDVAKLADLGLAKAFDTAGLSGLTRTGMIGGTLAFMPRDQVVDYKYARPAVDVWAMAASLYYMVSGRSPRDFPPGADPVAVVLSRPAVPLRERSGAVPAELASVVDTALADESGLAFPTARELSDALAATV
jgi:serine/threonine protein kinase